MLVSRVALTTCQVIIAGTLLASVIGKLIDPSPFMDALRLNRKLSSFAPIIGVIVILTEILLVGMLVFTPWIVVGLLGSIALFSLFTLWMYSIYKQGLRVSCGCFGDRKSTIGKFTILRNFILILISFVGVLFASHAATLVPKVSLFSVLAFFILSISIAEVQAFLLARSNLVLTGKQLLNFEKKQQA